MHPVFMATFVFLIDGWVGSYRALWQFAEIGMTIPFDRLRQSHFPGAARLRHLNAESTALVLQ